MAVNTTSSKSVRSFKGGSSPITQRVDKIVPGSPTPFSVLTPLKFPNNVGDTFKVTTSVAEGVIENFKNMIMTNYGERLGKPDFGANLNSLLSERLSQEDWNSRLSNSIKNTTQKYMSYITVNSIASNELPSRNDGFSRVQVIIIYSILALGIENRRLDITLTNLS